MSMLNDGGSRRDCIQCEPPAEATLLLDGRGFVLWASGPPCDQLVGDRIFDWLPSDAFRAAHCDAVVDDRRTTLKADSNCGRCWRLDVRPCDVAPAAVHCTATETPSEFKRLTEREQHVLREIVLTPTTAVGAQNLGVAESTVRNHLRNIRRKLGPRTIAELTLMSVHAGLLDEREPAATRAAATPSLQVIV